MVMTIQQVWPTAKSRDSILTSNTNLSISIVPLMLLGVLADRDGAIDMRRAA